MDTSELFLILPDIYQNTFCTRGFAEPAVRGVLFGCCTDARRSTTQRKHHCTVSDHLRKYIKFHYKSPGCNSLDSRHLEIFAGVERTEEINFSGLFCFIWKVVYSLISLRQWFLSLVQQNLLRFRNESIKLHHLKYPPYCRCVNCCVASVIFLV